MYLFKFQNKFSFFALQQSDASTSRDFDGIVSHLRMFRKGDILARQGDVCNRLMILLKGSVRGEMIDYSGRLDSDCLHQIRKEGQLHEEQ